MKSDKEVNEQVDEENQTQEGRAKKGTSNAKNYTSRCTSLGLHKMFAALPEEEKGVLHATCFAPLLLIDLIAMMLTLVVEIFDRHLSDMKFQFGETIIQMKPIHVRLLQTKDVLRLNFLKIILSFLLPNKGRNVEVRYQIEAPVIGVAPTIGIPTIGAPTVVVPVIGSSSSATEIGVVVVRVCSQLEEHGKMLHTHGKMLEQISMSTVGDSTLPLGDTLLLEHYQFSTPEKEEDGKRMMAEPRIKNDDDVEVGREVHFNTISSEYGGDLLEKGEEKENDDKKYVEEKVKSEEEEVQKASVDQTTIISIEEQTLKAKKIEDEASQTKESKEKVEQNKEEVFEGRDNDDGNLQNKLDPEQIIKQMAIDQTNVIDVYIKALIQFFDTQHRAYPEKERIVLAVIFAC
ncbi:hypothetical protein GIB67_039920 [Kingdonia uniflora]|uniref:Uncharacterized protein n=1 Tax=Kingdonia uniflora TaxID=39325 RepID=A0A7J7P3D9_9MAGN|nr:hypothetical protein GIB67_039920 [Kingdonia uniflora]